MNTGKERAQVSLLLTWAVSGSTLLVVANCDYVRFSKILWDYSIFSHNYLFYTEFNWRCLTPIRRSRERTIYVSIYHSISFSFHILVVLQLIFNPYLSYFWQRWRWSLWRTPTSQASHQTLLARYDGWFADVPWYFQFSSWWKSRKGCDWRSEKGQLWISKMSKVTNNFQRDTKYVFFYPDDLTSQ